MAWFELGPPAAGRIAGGAPEAAAGPRPLSVDRWRSLVDELAELGAQALELAGGAPLAHPACRPLLARARARGLAVELDLGDGTVLPDEATLDLLADAGAGLVFPLLGDHPAAHDAATGVAGSWARTLEAVAGATRREIPVRVAAVLGPGAEAGAGVRIEALARSLGVTGRVAVDHPRPAAPAAASDPRVGGDAHASCVAVDDRWFRRTHVFPDGPVPRTCWDGRLAVTFDGRVLPCPFSRSLVVGSVVDGALASVLSAGRLGALWGMTVDDVPACEPCDRKGTCYDCRALALAAGGGLTAKRPNCGYRPPVERFGARRPDRLRSAEGLALASCDGEVLVLDMTARRLHRLNETAAYALMILASGHTIDEAATRLAAELPEDEDLTDAQLRDDMDAIAQSFWAEGLLLDPETEAAPPVAELDPPSLAVVPTSASTPERAELDIAGVRCRLEASEAAWPGLEPWVAPLRAEARGLPARHRVTVRTLRSGRGARPTHQVLHDGRPRFHTSGPDALRWLLADTLTHVAMEAPGCVSFHAAAVSGRRGAILLPGASGAGKSTLALHAVAGGLGYLTDELVNVELSDGWVRPFPRPAGVKPEGRALVPEGLRHLYLPGSDETQAWLALPAADAAPLAAVVVPDRRRSAPLAGIGPADAAEALVAQVFNVHAHGPDRFLQLLVALLERTPCYSLGTADLPAAVAALVELAGGAPDTRAA